MGVIKRFEDIEEDGKKFQEKAKAIPKAELQEKSVFDKDKKSFREK